MNWREIDAVLAELDLEEYWLRKIRQPDYMRIILEFSGSSGGCALELVLRAPFVRINRLGALRKIPKALPRPPRFTAVLKSRLEGARLGALRQLGTDRIVRFVFAEGDQEIYLDAKLWGNAANLILSDSTGLVIDSFSRRPGRNEAPGLPWPPEGIPLGDESEHQGIKSKRFTLRELPGDGDWNERVEAWYLELERSISAGQRLEKWSKWLDRRENQLTIRRSRLEESCRRFETQLDDTHLADLILSSLHRVSRGDRVLETEDWNEPGSTIRIPLKETLDPQENAEAYFARAKRARRGLKRLEEDRGIIDRDIAGLKELKARMEEGDTASPPFDSDPPEDQGKQDGDPVKRPGLWIHRSPYIIAVGRNARESDWLLRRWARGNDTWLHVRDWPGGHVFVRAPRGKSIPLELLLDAGNLALSYSSTGAEEADLYYTQVKNLRRGKNADTGTVLPSREKNLRIRLDGQRLDSLKQLARSG